MADKPHRTIGIIGHIDHGKTSLVSALSAFAAKRWGLSSAVPFDTVDSPEASRFRGMGFLVSCVDIETAESAATLVDCRGFSDWTKVLISGRPRLDAAILVVSATDGPMAQARELLNMLSFLGIPCSAAVLSRCDLVDDEELLDLVEMDTRELLDGAGFDGYGVDVLRGDLVSAAKDPAGEAGEMLLELCKAIDNLPVPVPLEERPFLMPVDDVISIPGKGIVATGTVERGTIRTGDVLEIPGCGAETRRVTVSAIQVSRKVQDQTGPGDSVGLLLSGLNRGDMDRGQVLAAPRSMHVCSVFEGLIYVYDFKSSDGAARVTFTNALHFTFRIRTSDTRGYEALLGSNSMCMPGDCARIRVELLNPVAMDKGTRFEICENGRTVAYGAVTELLEENPAVSTPSQPARQTSSPKPPKADPDELFRQGRAYHDAEEYVKAAECWKKAAAQGHARAQLRLAHSYRLGRGVEKDLKKAFRLYQSSAESGNDQAQANLGSCYYMGLGVEKDLEKGIFWLKKAAETGFALAMRNLGTIYYNEGNMAEALRWHRRAAAAGEEKSKDFLKEYDK